MNLHIINRTDIKFTPVASWFDSGHLDDEQEITIPKRGDVTIPFYPDGAGVSGFLTWWTDDEVAVCIAFSNPLVGHNKLDISVTDNISMTDKELWDNMDYHNYQPFDKDLDSQLKAHCSCTGGGTNNAKIILENNS
ncbi:MAG: hypothetical protein KZQ63_01050 [Candidatus Thiodiazotropha sp. (ex Lucinoma aequizonata)]|nr:hypothetical protein [Candidatus Thiodiazotropha sp. (ex Lucinoma aequizonata)]